MRWKLYFIIMISTLMVVRTKQAEDFNLLPYDLISKYSHAAPSIDMSAPGGKYLDLSGINTEIRVPLSELEFGEKSISSPYLIHMKFKILDPVSSISLFTIKDDLMAKMRVEITAEESLTIVLLNVQENYAMFDISENVIGNWTDLIIRVDKEVASLFYKCQEIDKVENLENMNVELDKNAFLVFNDVDDDTFKGAIAEIRLYSQADELSLDSLCIKTPETTSTIENDNKSNFSITTSNPVTDTPETTSTIENNNESNFSITTSNPVTDTISDKQVYNISDVPNFNYEYNFLPLEQITKYSDVEPPIDESVLEDMFLNYTGIYTKIPISELGFSSGQILSEPYSIRMSFKLLEQVNQSSMFSLKDGLNMFMTLKFTTLNDKTIVTIKVPGTDDINFEVDDIVEKETNYLIQVYNGNVTLFENCTELQRVAAPTMERMPLSNNTFLVLGDENKSNNFKGSIKELKLYPNLAIENNCKEDNMIEDPIDQLIFEAPKKGERGDELEKGIKGEKGEKGDPGLKGEPGQSITGVEGPPGFPGVKGPPGPRGEEGKCQCSESVISSLLKTMPEMRGPVGETGPQGIEGPSGLNGSVGIQGPKGERGLQGLSGVKGEKGGNGTAGREGKPGIKGESGETGPRGPPGSNGIAGPPGPTGPTYVLTEKDKKEMKGVPGDKGSQGLPGSVGPMGKTGQKGEIGAQGLRGEQGIQGTEGQQGEKGDKGENGVAGKDGLPGSSGYDGKNGLAGEKGEKGDIGLKGSAGSPGTLMELLDSKIKPNEYDQIVDKLRGVKGENGNDGKEGSKGEKGASGLPGTPGKDGQEGKEGPRGPQGLKGDIGPMGLKGTKGEQGNPGPPGEVPASVIAKMKGSKGDTGRQGQKGSKGDKGHVGKDGEPGKVGANGEKGDKGLPGPIGPIGPSGYNGTTGEKGQKGECAAPFDYKKLRGDKGDKGIPGQQGKPGPRGPAGICTECDKVPKVGPPGPPGLPGRPGVSLVGPKGEPGQAFTLDPPENKGIQDVQCGTVMISRTIEALVKRTSEVAVGTLAYVPGENILVIRGDYDWQFVKMETLSSFKQPTNILPKQSPRPIISPEQSSRRPWIYPAKTRSYIRIAALNDPYNGHMKNLSNGRRDAEFLCLEQSRKYGGDFQPFWTNSKDSLKSVIHEDYRHLPVRNLREGLLFNSWESIFSGGGKFIKNAKIYSFDGKDVMRHKHWPIKMVWHGSNTSGTQQSMTCNQWQSESSKFKGTASYLNTYQLLGQNPVSCDKQLIVLCVGILK